MKPLIVGETNPYGADPKYALYPFPRSATGHRLCSKILCVPDNVYLEYFERVNLCTGKWKIAAARKRARELVRAEEPMKESRLFVLLGAKVAHAFGLEFEPFTCRNNYRLAPDGIGCIATVQLPHPSGLNRMWNEPGAYDRAHQLLLDNGAFTHLP